MLTLSATGLTIAATGSRTAASNEAMRPREFLTGAEIERLP